MKTLILTTLITLLFTSCSTTNTLNNGPFQKRKYTKGFHIGSKNDLAITNGKNELTQKTLVKELKAGLNSPNITDSDTIKNSRKDTLNIELKSGRIIKGEIIDSDSFREGLFGSKKWKLFYHYRVHTLANDTIYIANGKVKNIYNPKVEQSELKLHPKSKQGLILYFIGLVTAPIFIGGLILAIGWLFHRNGLLQTELNPTLYNYKKARKIKLLYSRTSIIVIILLIITLPIFIYLISMI